MTEEVINDYQADSDLAPKKRGRPAKVIEAMAEEPALTPAPVEEVLIAEEVYISPQTKLEMEAGRKALMGIR